jgi:penicillin-insensitive murein endopeptidase
MFRWHLALGLLAVAGCARAPATTSPIQPAQAQNEAAPVAGAAAPCKSAAAGEACPGSPPSPTAGDALAMTDDGDLDDDLEGGDSEAEGPPPPPKSPVVMLTDEEIAERLRRDPASLGSMSVGQANGGALVNAVQMPQGEQWRLLEPASAWGTQETIDSLVRSINKVNEQFPGGPQVLIGHISSKHGGYLSPHKSHQSGRDVDIGYYYRGAQPRGFYRATAENIDLEKTWAFLKTLIKGEEVDMIFIDVLIQRMLFDYALKHGEDEAWLDAIFQSRRKVTRPIVRHVKGHVNHFHIRFYNPIAQQMARRARIHFNETVAIPALHYAQHKARSGDTLGILARRYGTTVAAIQQANGLRSNALRAGIVYKIPQKASPMPKARASAPPRRSPQAKVGMAKGAR